ncbi:hypothetical protein PPSIR1_29068 [Plesiocystis pacifica SIR-1]|uniref:Lipoprotein n=1 Tax=Plesiocystis pacifica SIR-1 TaxID=391625 RepID=A6GHU5_9BACT|nr:hypothetical protein [Plesiocystis pacifica]EDM74542.1 hypothetical protein PPSIR1_29068 [Plesiocystis pacifica SIR-1]
MNPRIVLLTAASLAFTIGCADEGFDEGPDGAARLMSSAPPEQVELTPFAEVELEEGHQLSFYADPEEPSAIVVTEVTPEGGTGVVRAAREAGATSLELFRFVAPEAEVPAELEYAHAFEVEARGGAERATLPLELAMTHASSPPCTSEGTFDDWFGDEYGKNPDALDSFYTASGGPTGFWLGESTTTYLDYYGGGCNKDGGTKQFKYCWSGNGWLYACGSPTSVSAGSTWSHQQFSSSPRYHTSQVLYPYQVSGTSRLAFALEG